MISIGFSGTRSGMSEPQWDVVQQVLYLVSSADVFSAHHGDCIGSDAEFHASCMASSRARVILHPGPVASLRAFSVGATSERVALPFLVRNRAIVDASDVLIAAPMEYEPQASGGTWHTIGLARQALRRHLRALYVVGRDGELLDHTSWKEAVRC
jgi:hypothetical protein